MKSVLSFLLIIIASACFVGCDIKPIEEYKIIQIDVYAREVVSLKEKRAIKEAVKTVESLVLTNLNDLTVENLTDVFSGVLRAFDVDKFCELNIIKESENISIYLINTDKIYCTKNVHLPIIR